MASEGVSPRQSGLTKSARHRAANTPCSDELMRPGFVYDMRHGWQ